jgi:signal transduction histidine kinase
MRLLDIVYGYLLAVFMLIVYCLVEYVLRLPFYRDILSRLKRDMAISDGDIPLAGVTAEQRMYSQLLKRYQDAYSKQLTELHERRQFFETFTTRFAHQMKTPVTVIRLLEKEMRVSPPSEQLLDTLAEQCQRLESSIDAMLYTARLNHFSFDAKMEQVDILNLLRRVVNDHKAEWIRRKIYPRIECCDHDRDKLMHDDFSTAHDESVEPAVYVTTDAKWLTFIVEQIVRNALQYGYKRDEHGQPFPATFHIQVTRHESQVSIRFIDEGIGIPERELRYVFDAFYTGSNGRSHSRATGMGLYLVKEVAAKLGIEVGISSILGNGTTVELLFHTSQFYSPAEETLHVTKL